MMPAVARVRRAGDSRGFIVNLRFIAVAALIALSAFALGVLVAINVASPA
jgi:hypothetical protein